MFQYITGDVKGIYDNYIVLENNGIGYKIFTSLSTIRKLKINENFLINVKYVVREDSVSLYGFYSNEELDMFDLLTKVSSVGPKNAMSILSTLSLSELQKAIVNNDVASITRTPGIGNKTGSRIILELKDKISFYGDFSDEDVEISLEQNNDFELASDALVNLGYMKYEITKVLSKIADKNMPLEEIIKFFIKELSK